MSMLPLRWLAGLIWVGGFLSLVFKVDSDPSTYQLFSKTMAKKWEALC